MKKILIAMVLVFAAKMPLKAQVESPRLEIGVVAGVPSGISIKYWFDPRSAIDVGGGWSFEDERIDIYGDYLYHYFAFELDRGKLPLYFGLGAAFQLADENFFGVRVPLGASYFFADAPFSVFAEIAPIMRVVPETEFDLGGGVGIRLTIGRIPFVD